MTLSLDPNLWCFASLAALAETELGLTGLNFSAEGEGTSDRIAPQWRSGGSIYIAAAVVALLLRRGKIKGHVLATISEIAITTISSLLAT